MSAAVSPGLKTKIKETYGIEHKGLEESTKVLPVSALEVLDKDWMGLLLLSIVPNPGNDPCNFHRTCLVGKDFADCFVVGAVLNKEMVNCIDTLLAQFSGGWTILQSGRGWVLRRRTM